MSSVSSAASYQVALTQMQVKTEIATRLMKVAQETGPEQQMLSLVQDATESVAQMASAAGGTPNGLDVYV